MNVRTNRRRLSGQEITGEILDHVDLRSAISYATTYKEVTFKSCKLGQGDFRDSLFIDCTFVNCDLAQAFLVSRIYRCSFTNSNFDQAALTGSDIRDSKFTNCRFEYANFSRATVIDSIFKKCQFHGTLLDFAFSKGLDFSGSNLWGAIIPITCAFVSGTKFDRTQIEYFLAFLGYVDSDPSLIKQVQGLTSARSRKVVERLVGRQGQNSMDDSGRITTEMGHQEKEVRSPCDPPSQRPNERVDIGSCTTMEDISNGQSGN